MSIPSSITPLFSTGSSAAAAGYQVERSLRFNSSDSAYLSKSITNITTFTLSYWMKRCGSGRDDTFVTENSSGFFYFVHTDGSIRVNDNTANRFTSNGLYRDPSAWYHIVINNNGSTFNLYVNGILDKSVSVNLALYSGTALIGRDRVSSPSSHANFYLADIHFIDGQALTPAAFTQVSATTGQLIPKAYAGTYTGNSFWLKFNDNSAATATTLGKDSFLLGNNWTPSANISVTAGAGNDSLVDTPTSYGTDTGAGGEVRGNYATLNPLDTNATTTNGNLEVSNSGFNDTPATIHIISGKFYMEAILATASGTRLAGFTRASNSGKNHAAVDSFRIIYESAGASGLIARDGTGLSNTTGLDGYTTNDVIGFAIDISAGTISFYKNNVFINTTTNALITNNAWKFYVSGNSVSWAVNFGQRAFAYAAPSGFKALCDTNLPAPLVALPSTVFNVITYTGNGSTQTLPNANSTPSTPLAFSPDWVWIKARSTSAYNHFLLDTVRGVNNELNSNTTDFEYTRPAPGSLTAFNSDGFNLNTAIGVNASSTTYVAWAWDAGANSSKTYTVTVASAGGANRYFIDGVQQATINLEEGSTYIFDQSAASNSSHPLRFSTTSNGTHGGGTEYTTGVTTVGTPGNAGAYTQIAVASSAPALYYYCTNHSGMGGAINTNTTAGASNFVGSITSQVRANVSAGFSVITYTGTGANATVGHGLGVAPDMVIYKTRTGTASNWIVYHRTIGGTGGVQLNVTTAAFSDNSPFNGTNPTSTVLHIGTNYQTNSAVSIVAYCFAPVVGYSSFGSYTGNGSADGPFVYTGFRPRWVMYKVYSGDTGHWFIHDTSRDPYNEAKYFLAANLSAEETTYIFYPLDILSNGFKIRSNNGNINGSGYGFIYMAFAENPFQYARAR